MAALVAAGVAEDQVDIVTPEDAPHFDASIDRQGFTGTLTRFIFSLGDDLDELEQLRAELRSGSVLVGVPVQGEAAIQHIHLIMREQGGHSIVSFGRWTITPFEEQ